MDLLHSLWKEATRDPKFRELHHYHILNVALQEMEGRMHDGAQREQVMKDLEDEMCRPCGPTLPDEGSVFKLKVERDSLSPRMADSSGSC